MAKTILDARDCRSIKELDEAVLKRVIGAHVCFEAILVREDIAQWIAAYTLRECKLDLPWPGRFKGFQLMTTLPLPEQL